MCVCVRGGCDDDDDDDNSQPVSGTERNDGMRCVCPHYRKHREAEVVVRDLEEE